MGGATQSGGGENGVVWDKDGLIQFVGTREKPKGGARLGIRRIGTKILIQS